MHLLELPVKVSILFLLVLGSVKVLICKQAYVRASQSYSCWYWVLSGYLKTINLTIKTSQSYSCWYWVLSIEFYDSDGQFIFVSILFRSEERRVGKECSLT